MDTRSCRECGADVLILPSADLGGRRIAFEVFEVPVESLPDLRHAFAYQRHRGVVCLQGWSRVRTGRCCGTAAIRVLGRN